MAEGLFLHSYNESSERFAVLDEYNEVAFLYLSKVGEPSPEKDSIAYMRIEPKLGVDLTELAEKGLPPQISRELASERSVLAHAEEQDFSFLWSKGGNSVALLYKREPITFISTTEKLGYSKSVKMDSSLVNSWNQAKYDAIFQ